MSRPISKRQFDELWLAELRPASNETGCILCGGTSFIDTRGKVFDRLGQDAGGEAYCLCPNGRAMKRLEDADERRLKKTG